LEITLLPIHFLIGRMDNRCELTQLSQQCIRGYYGDNTNSR
jgi:hypothetical protein